MWYYPFRHAFCIFYWREYEENWEIITECNVSIEREQKIILAKKVSLFAESDKIQSWVSKTVIP